MIFKYCVWPTVPKDEAKTVNTLNCGNTEIVNSAFRCCPCAVRRRRTVGVEYDGVAIVSEIKKTTPVISLRPNQSAESIDKANVEEDENNEKNRNYVSANASPYRIQQTDAASQCSGGDRLAYDVSSESSGEERAGVIETRIIENANEDNGGDYGDKSFDVITSETNPSRRNSIEQASTNVLLSGAESTDQDKETSSDNSGRDNDSDEKGEPVRVATSASSVVSNETNSTDSVVRISGSPARTNGIKAIAFDHRIVSADAADGPDVSLAYDRGYSTELKIDIESRVRASIYPETKTHFQQTDYREPSPDERSGIECDKKTTAVNSVSIVVASRPHSRTTTAEYREPAFQPLDFRQPHDDDNSTGGSIFHVSRTYEDAECIDVTTEQLTVATSDSFTELPDDPEIHVVTISKVQHHATPQNENGTVKDVVKIHEIETTKRLPCRVPRSRIKSRTGVNKIVPIGHHADKTPGRSKPSTLQCISQLESNDWETTIRGLKSLSTIARQHPEQLDTCPPGTVGRLLGRHVRNLRSQVARTACLAAGDVFGSQARCIDQDLDDIAGPLLQRTADTNKFLRADSNAALDRMIEHIPPHKTITVIVHRGASHQNAIVRAATARLLSSVVDLVGPDLAMSLPREVRDKLLGAGAKLLMDGNLDARNHAKIMFKRLSRCDGFRRALTDSVPEATLRHIDKTLRSL